MQIIEDRRTLHGIAELGIQLPKTLDYLRLKLAFLSCQVFSPLPGTLCAWFDFGADRAIAFRSEISALPITENTGKSYASRYPGKMHASGNDAHMAILLELARRLERKKPNINILLVFQSDDDTGNVPRALCRTGVFKKYRVEAIFAMQLWPGLTEGIVASRKNEMLCRSCQITVEITGKAAHVSNAPEGLDAMAAGVEFYTRARTLEAALPETVFRMLHFGTMRSGTTPNTLSAKTVLTGTLRTFQDDTYHQLRAGLVTLAKELEDSTGCTVAVDMTDGYPAVINPEPLYSAVRSKVRFQELAVPSLRTQDFSWYQHHLPGVFFFLGTGDSPALYAEDFDFNEAILSKGADFLEALATTY